MKNNQVKFGGQMVDKEKLDNWLYEKGEKPEIIIYGTIYIPMLVADPEEFGMHCKWDWVEKE